MQNSKVSLSGVSRCTNVTFDTNDLVASSSYFALMRGVFFEAVMERRGKREHFVVNKVF